MSDPSILFVKPKAISQRDKKALQGAGVIVVEIDDPTSAKLVRAGTEVDGGAMLNAAAYAIANAGYANGNAKELFGKAVCAAIEATFPSPPRDGER